MNDSGSLFVDAGRWPFLMVLSRIAMSIGVGLLVGLEREHSQKTGVRTFALVSLLGCLGGLMGNLFAGIALAFVALIVTWMNYRQMVLERKLALTTTTGMICVGFSAVLFGQGHLFTPAVTGIVTAALLAWKDPISRFALGLTDRELRSAILLAILSFVILPVLPDHPVDPWGLVEPRSNWASVIVIAGLGFVNYILLKIFGPRGMEITAFLGGLVNSRKVVVELAMRLRELGEIVAPSVYRGIMLATGAMLIRNVLIVVLLATQAAKWCAAPFLAMIATSAVLWRLAPAAAVHPSEGTTRALPLESPFRLTAALKFGLVFLGLNVVGGLAQREFGESSFYFVSAAGGLLSSASSIAAAATLINHHEISVATGVNGVILASLTSILINIPLIQKMTDDASLRGRTCRALIVVAGAGAAGVAINYLLQIVMPRWLGGG